LRDNVSNNSNPVANPGVSTSFQVDVHTANNEDGLGVGIEEDLLAHNHVAIVTPRSPSPGAASASNPTGPVGFSVAVVAPPEHTQATGSIAAVSVIAARSSIPMLRSAATEAMHQAPQCTVTHGQRDISKPKIYTDGTIRYSFLTTTGEPENQEDAL
jgi:hypothetical protein